MILKIVQFLCISVYFFFVFLQGAFANIDIKMSDAIAPFFDENKKIEHYSNIPFYQLDSYGETLLDRKQLEQSKQRFTAYVQHLKEAGYNALSLDDINHVLVFEKSARYPKDSHIFQRNTVYKNYYKELIAIARKQGLQVFFNTDMQFYTSVLEQQMGKIDENNTELSVLNKEAFEELFTVFPEISGVILRVGEGGSSYNAGDYKSKIVYTTPQSVNTLLQELLPILEQHEKQLVFRTWTIGIGKIGNLVHNTDTYDAVFAGIDSKNIIVSIKHTPGDFFWFPELNPTIGHGTLPQIVEIQIRREYEGGGDIPNYMGAYYQKIYEEIQEKPTVVGVYNWNQTGGWGWGHNILFNFGFTFWNEVNFYAVGNVLQYGKPDLESVLARFSLTKKEQQVVKNILLRSRESIQKGWYIDEFRKQNFEISGIKLPPLLWIWWDRTTSAPLVLSLVSNLVSSDNSIEQSADILALQQQEIEKFRARMSGSILSKNILSSLENRYQIFTINHLFKQDVFSYFSNKDIENKEVVQQKLQRYKLFLQTHPQFHYDFTEVEKFYNSHRSSDIWMVVHIVAVVIYFLFYLNFLKIKQWYNTNTAQRIVTLFVFLLLIGTILITPILFLNAFNIFYILLYINTILIVLISLYFFVFGMILSKLYSIKFRITSNFLRVLYLVFPVIVVLEIVVTLSLFFGEQLFWNYVIFPYIQAHTRVFFGVLFFVYFLLFVYYAGKIANIFPINTGKKHIKKIYVGMYVLLPLYLLFLFSVNEQIFVNERILQQLLPDYFFEAGSDVGEFF